MSLPFESQELEEDIMYDDNGEEIVDIPEEEETEEVDPQIQYAMNSRMTYNTGVVENIEGETDTFEFFNTPEFRALNAKFSDPLTLNVKLMIDFDKPYGLFAAESHVDSALAYLSRIGDTVRYNALVRWIDIFKKFIKDFDFLILGVEGLDTIVNANPAHCFSENDKITVNIRETSDMMVQSILTMYRSIWYDNDRGVEVLPANLRRFDAWFLLYSSGYYNMMLYDIIDRNNLTEENVETQMYPTLKKLSQDFTKDRQYKFNHHLIVAEDASINNEESGKNFFSSISNEMNGDFVKNTMVFNFRFGSYNGKFANLYGDFDISESLAIFAAHSKFSNLMWSQFSEEDITNPNIQLYAVDEGDQSNWFVRTVASVGAKYLQATFGPNSPMGNLFANLGSTVTNLATSALSAAQKEIEDKLIYDNIAKINKMFMSNFDDAFGVYNSLFGEDITNIEHQENMEYFENIPSFIKYNNKLKVNDDYKGNKGDAHIINENNKIKEIPTDDHIEYDGEENQFTRTKF